MCGVHMVSCGCVCGYVAGDRTGYGSWVALVTGAAHGCCVASHYSGLVCVNSNVA